MKILLISPIYPRENEPALGIHVQRIHRLYQRLGYEVDLVVYQAARGPLDKGAKMLRFLREIRGAVSRGGYDLVNIQYPFIAAIPFRFLKSPMPMVTSVHGSDIVFNTPLKRMLGRFTRHLLEGSAAVIAPSDYFRTLLLRRYALDPQRVLTCPPGGYDGRIFHPARETVRKPDSLRWIGFASRIVQGKGWQVALDAFIKAQADPALRHVGLLLAGSGPEAQELQERLAALPKALAGRVRWIGNLEEKDMADFYRKLEVFVFPTLFEESLGLVAIESLACGTPVIASDAGGIRGYVESGRNGYLVEAGNVDRWAQKLIDYFNLSGAERAAMARCAPASVERYEMNQVAQRLDAILRSLSG